MKHTVITEIWKSSKASVSGCHSGRVGDEGGEVVGEDRGDDDGPRRRSGATRSKGERSPLLLLLP